MTPNKHDTAKAIQKNSYRCGKGTMETSKVLRFWKNEVLSNIERVLEK